MPTIFWRHPAREEVARQVRCRGRDVNLGHYEDPELAAWVADFARYMVFGLKPAYWHHNVGRPNFPPGDRLGVPRLTVLYKLVRQDVVERETLQVRLAEYNASPMMRTPGLRAYLRPSPATGVT